MYGDHKSYSKRKKKLTTCANVTTRVGSLYNEKKDEKKKNGKSVLLLCNALYRLAPMSNVYRIDYYNIDVHTYVIGLCTNRLEFLPPSCSWFNINGFNLT